MPNPLALALLAGLVSSGLFLSLLSGLPLMVLLAYFVQLPLIFIGLTVGLAGSVIAAAAALLVCGLIAGIVAAGIFFTVQALPAIFVVRQALLARRSEDGRTEWYPPGLLLAQLAVLAAAGIVLAFVALSAQPGGLKGAVESFLRAALTELGAIEARPEAAAEPNGWLFLFPGLMAASWLIMVVVNFLLAQAVAVRMGWNRRPTPDLDALELPAWLWPCLGVAVFLSLFDADGLGFLGRSTLVVLAAPYLFLGLAVLHVLARRWSHPGLALAAIYGAIVLFGWPLLVVLLLGFAEDFLGLRRRLS